MSIDPAGTHAPAGRTTVDARLLTLGRVLAVTLVTVGCLRVAWVGDDALITLRTALNITHGWGPGFNATEAVQGFTHPLWFLLWTAVGSLSEQWIVGMLAMSLALTALGVGLMVWRTVSIARIILVSGLLLLSNAFVEYSTSGLENPLAYATVGLLMSMSVGAWLPAARHRSAWAVLFGLTVAAVVLTRLDLALLLLPIVGLTIARHRRDGRLLVVGTLSGVIPVALWAMWSWITYASVLPNTFEAKRNVDIPQFELLVQGFRYLWVTFEHDPVTLVALLVGLGLAFALGRATERAWAVGVLLYVGYVVWVGGDFMAGRFLAVPVYVSVFLLAVVPVRTATRQPASAIRASAVAASTAIVLALAVISSLAGRVPTALSNAQAPRWEVDTNLNAGVGDERGVYAALGHTLKSYLDTLALAPVNPSIVPIGDGSGLSRTLKEIDGSAHEWAARPAGFTRPSEVGVFCGMLGSVGIATGPITHLVDNCALTDRFLAGRPAVARDFDWKPGHFLREIPEGYLEAIRADDPSLMSDPADAYVLARLWSRIRPPATHAS